MKPPTLRAIVAVAVLAYSLGGFALAAQNRYAVKVPDGLGFAEFKGYETWQTVSVSQVKDGIKLISANPAMIEAYKNGLPAAGKTFPEGSRIVKIEWTQKENAESPYFVMVPDALESISFIVKDSKRFRRPMAGPTPSSCMTPRPARSSRTGPARLAATPVTRAWRPRTTSSPPFRRGRSAATPGPVAPRPDAA